MICREYLDNFLVFFLAGKYTIVILGYQYL